MYKEFLANLKQSQKDSERARESAGKHEARWLCKAAGGGGGGAGGGGAGRAGKTRKAGVEASPSHALERNYFFSRRGPGCLC